MIFTMPVPYDQQSPSTKVGATAYSRAIAAIARLSIVALAATATPVADGFRIFCLMSTCDFLLDEHMRMIVSVLRQVFP